jgi:glycosyltransferase involved in cell wall biosynthesis
MAEPLRRALGAPVCCTLQGEELFVDTLVEPYRSRALDMIRRQAATVDKFIAVSQYCANFMTDWLAVSANRMAVVPLGIRMDGYGTATPATGRPFTVGYFARIAPEKGLHVLADAYIKLRPRTGNMPMRLAAAGYLSGAHASYLAGVRERLEHAGLAHEFDYKGEVDRAGKLAFLNGLDILSVPATYDEPKGLFLLEAMASGVPVVQPRRGAFTEVVEATGGGVLVAPDSTESLADGIQSLSSDPVRRQALAAHAREGVRQHYTLAQSADRFLAVVDEVTRSQPARASVA